MKTLIIHAIGEKMVCGQSFGLTDPETGEILETHFCSNSGYAKSDLHDSRKERLVKWEKKFGQKTEAKHLSETNYNWDEILLLTNKNK